MPSRVPILFPAPSRVPKPSHLDLPSFPPRGRVLSFPGSITSPPPCRPPPAVVHVACRPSVPSITFAGSYNHGPWALRLPGSPLRPLRLHLLAGTAAGAVPHWFPLRLFASILSFSLLGSTFYSPSPQKSMSPCSDHLRANDLCAGLFEDAGYQIVSW